MTIVKNNECCFASKKINNYNDNNSKHKTYILYMQYELNYLKKVSPTLFYNVLTFLKNIVPDQ